MRIPSLSALLFSLLSGLAGCSPSPTHSNGNFGASSHLHFAPRLSHKSQLALSTQFAAAHARADSLVKLAIPAAADWGCLTTSYGFSYPGWEASLKDSLPGPAREYKFYYGLLHQGDTIQSAVVSIGPDLRIYPSELAELSAYQQFQQGKLAIGRQKAVEIGRDYGFQPAGAGVTFHSGEGMRMDTLPSLQEVSAYYADLATHPVLFYWELRSGCVGCAYLSIDAANGQLLQQGKTGVMY